MVGGQEDREDLTQLDQGKNPLPWKQTIYQYEGAGERWQTLELVSDYDQKAPEECQEEMDREDVATGAQLSVTWGGRIEVYG